MRTQTFEIDKKENIILTNVITDDDIIKMNYEQRKDGNNGWSLNKTLKKCASIPFEVLINDPDGLIFYQSGFGSPEGKVAFNRFIIKHPEYRTSKGRI